MREPVDRSRVRRLMEALGRVAERDVHVYLVGGTTAVMMGWRDSTVDVDMVVRPDDDALLRAIPALKESLGMNVELASPADFIPVPVGWEDRSPVVARVGRVTFHHFDLYAQALAKVERGHQKDVADVRAMVARGLIEPSRARTYFALVEPELYRFPAIHAAAFRRAVAEAFPEPDGAPPPDALG
jgi:hypothetical protein